MAKIEAQPTSEDATEQGWTHQRNEIQTEVMKRMGVPVDKTQDTQQQKERSKAVDTWVTSYAEKFSSVVNQNVGLQDRLMSDNETIRQSTMEEVIHILQEKDNER